MAGACLAGNAHPKPCVKSLLAGSQKSWGSRPSADTHSCRTLKMKASTHERLGSNHTACLLHESVALAWPAVTVHWAGTAAVTLSARCLLCMRHAQVHSLNASQGVTHSTPQLQQCGDSRTASKRSVVWLATCCTPRVKAWEMGGSKCWGSICTCVSGHPEGWFGQYAAAQ